MLNKTTCPNWGILNLDQLGLVLDTSLYPTLMFENLSEKVFLEKNYFVCLNFEV